MEGQSLAGMSMIFSPNKAKDIRHKAAETQAKMKAIVPLLTLVIYQKVLSIECNCSKIVSQTMYSHLDIFVIGQF